MSVFPGFVGSTYTAQSPNVSAQRCVNLLVAVTQAAEEKQKVSYYRTPGLLERWNLGAGPIRGCWTQDGRAWVVSGSSLYEIFRDYSSTLVGDVNSDGLPVSFSQNLTQLFVTSAGLGFIVTLATTGFAQVTDVDFPANVATGIYTDTYFIVLTEQSPIFNISDPDTGLSWNGAEFGERSEGSCNFVAMVKFKRGIWFLGSLDSEVWYNSGAASFPFAPRPGVAINTGCLAAFSACVCDDAVYWLGGDADGGGVLYKAVEDYRPVIVSTDAVAHVWGTYATLTDAEAWTYQKDGRSFYVLYFPSADATWVYDSSLPPELAWTERLSYDTTAGTYHAHRGRCHMYAFGKHLVGDRATGSVYEMSDTVYTDNLQPLRWLRRSPHVNSENRKIKHKRFELECETGIALQSGQGSDPQVMLRWSNDNGHTWSNERWRSLGAVGKYLTRVIWRNLGVARDRIYELSGSDPVPIAIQNAYLDLEGGTN